MRINKFIALASGISRRAADRAIQDGQVTVNGQPASITMAISEQDIVFLNGQRLIPPTHLQTIMLHKPVGYVVSRNGQGSRTIYELLPARLHDLKPIGRLDKDSSGLLIMTNDGTLAQQLTHPSFQKIKQYQIVINQPLQPLHRQMISDFGVTLHDGVSRLSLDRLIDDDEAQWLVTMHEGRNRQIRRTFEALGYTVTRLHRIRFGSYSLPTDLKAGSFQTVG